MTISVVGCGIKGLGQIPWTRHAGNQIHSGMPEDYRNQAVIDDPCGTEQSAEKHGAHRPPSALVNMSQPEENGGDNDCRPDGRSSTDNCRQSKAAIEKLFTHTSSYGEGKG